MPVYRYRTKKGIRFMVKFSVNGKQYLKRGFLTREEGKKAEAAYVSGMRPFVRAPKLSVVVDGFLKWKSTQIKPSTFYQVRQRCDIYILRKFPDVCLDKITYSQLSLWWDGICRSKFKNKNTVLSILRAVFDYASIYYGFEGKDYKKLLPHKDFSIKTEVTEKVISFADFKRMYEYEDNEKYRLYLLLSFFTGMRIGELRGLQAKCFDGKHLSVFQQCASKNGKGNTLSSLKTSHSNRYYLLPDFISSSLSEWISKNSLADSDFIFFSFSHQDVLGQNTIVRELNRISDALDLGHINPHMFRHSEATLLFDNDVSLDQISKYLGHSSASVTNKYYIHETDEKQKEISDMLQEKFGRDF